MSEYRLSYYNPAGMHEYRTVSGAPSDARRLAKRAFTQNSSKTYAPEVFVYKASRDGQYASFGEYRLVENTPTWIDAKGEAAMNHNSVASFVLGTTSARLIQDAYLAALKEQRTHAQQPVAVLHSDAPATLVSLPTGMGKLREAANIAEHEVGVPRRSVGSIIATFASLGAVMNISTHRGPLTYPDPESSTGAEWSWGTSTPTQPRGQEPEQLEPDISGDMRLPFRLSEHKHRGDCDGDA